VWNKPSTVAKEIIVFSGMTITIAIIGAIFGLLAAFIGVQLLQDGTTGFGGSVGVLADMVIGYPIGVMIGIFLINKVLHYRGSLLFGEISSIIVVVFIIGLARPLGLNNNPDLLWALILLLPPVFGTIGFHLWKQE